MHELTLTARLLELIEEAAALNRLAQVDQVKVELGQLSCVSAEALSFCFNQLKKGSCAAGAELVIESVALEGFCPKCQAGFKVENLLFHCPNCRHPEIRLLRGEELCLTELSGEPHGD